MHKRVYVWNGYWTTQDVRAHPKWLFVFGDNDIGQGKGGQAIIRGERNAIGVPTKKYPDNRDSSFYSDKELEKNKDKIRAAVNKIYNVMRYYDALILPEKGLGTGLSDLPRRAPKTYEYLKFKIDQLVEELQK